MKGRVHSTVVTIYLMQKTNSTHSADKVFIVFDQFNRKSYCLW